jgi:hypothetical protein
MSSSISLPVNVRTLRQLYQHRMFGPAGLVSGDQLDEHDDSDGEELAGCRTWKTMLAHGETNEEWLAGCVGPLRR